MSFRRNEVLDAPVRILMDATIQLLSTKLDSRKILLTSQGIHRDWRGLAEQAGMDIGCINSGKISPTAHCIYKWRKGHATIGQFLAFLEVMDRFDVIDDALTLIYNDYDKCMTQAGGLAMTATPPSIDDEVSFDPDLISVGDVSNRDLGLGLEHYDALVLSAEEDCDFVQELIENIEVKYGFKLFLKERDLLAGLQFETESIVRLITERCTRVIVVLSPEFLASNVNKFFTNFALAFSIDQRRRIVIPCQVKPCEKPAVISFCHSLDYYRAKGYWNFWEKLRDSLKYQHSVVQGSRVPSIEPSERIQELPSSPTLSLSPTTPSAPSLSHSPNFFSKILSKAKSSQQISKGQAPDRNGFLNKVSESSDDICGRDSSSEDTQDTHRSHLNSIASSVDFNQDLNFLDSLPNVPDTPPSPMSANSSSAFLIPDNSTHSPRSQSKLLSRIFRGKQKRKDYG
ncbi:Myeloid differentiation primary response protein MyD88 [Halocaridina rubra]|uniref:Myeloid differentiation primary response protein MyD88 n=1 Tax=Halocaridina rubra TaxID=373956 RepID=A0AAN8WDV4_HALRR